MAKFSIEDKTLTNIADKLRSRADTSYKITPEGMPAEIDYVCDREYSIGYSDGYPKGYDAGEEDGYTDGHHDGYNLGYAEGITRGNQDGKKAQYDAFWDALQNKGNRRSYNFAFFSAEGLWTDENFKPKYDLVIKGGSDDTFYGLKATKLKKGFEGKEDLQIDTSEMTTANWLFFNSSNLTELPPLDFSKVTSTVGAFSGMSSLIKLHLTVSENTKFAAMSSGTFTGCKSLTDLKITGTIASDIGIPSCTALSADTIYTQIILNLKDYSADTSGTTHTLNLGATNLAKLTEAQISAATEKGWVVI